MFGEILREIVDQVPGAQAGVVMGADGILVENYLREGAGIEVQSAGVEFSSILGEVRRAAGQLDLGGVKDVVVLSDRRAILLKTINDEYFVALVLSPNGNHGRARFLLRMAVPRLRAEF